MPGAALQSDFTAGELSPSLSARVDLAKYNKGCRILQNFLVQPHGGAVKRPGFELLDELPGPARLIEFVFSNTQAYCLVFGNFWMRVATHDGFVLDGGGSPYQIATPYTLSQAEQLSFTQSADVLFIACHGIRPQMLKRLGHAHWEFEGMVFTAPLNPPEWSEYAEAENQVFQLAYAKNTIYKRGGGALYEIFELIGVDLYRRLDPSWVVKNHELAFPSGTAYIRDDQDPDLYTPIYENLWRRTGAGLPVAFINEAKMSNGSISPAQLTTPYTYHITALNADGKESQLSEGASIIGPASNNWQGGDYIKISWLPTPGAVEYRVYKSAFGGRPGYVATTGDSTWHDYNTLPSLSEGAPDYQDPFPNDDFPGTVGLFEQRLGFASSPNRPQTIWMSKSGDYSNFAVYTPIAADSPIEMTIASQEVSVVNWMVALRSLILGTTSMEWEVAGRGESAFSAMNKKATPQSYWGSSLKQAMVVGNAILHVSSSGSQVRTLQYEFAADSYGGMDLSIMASHLLEQDRIIDWAHQRNPDSIIWAVRSDGALLGLTYQAEHQIAAWHQHHTEGVFTAVCSVPNGFESSLFAVVERDSVYYLERMADRYKGGSAAGAVFLDCSLTYDGPPMKTIMGLDHLEGKVVGILADGAVMAPRKVQDGKVTLDHEAAAVTIGLQYTADLETMPVEVVDKSGTSVSLKKQVNAVDIVFRDTVGAKTGLSFDKMEEIKWRSDEPYGKPPSPYSGIKSITTNKLADNILSVCVRSDLPTPMTVLAIVSRIKVNP